MSIESWMFAGLYMVTATAAFHGINVNHDLLKTCRRLREELERCREDQRG